MNDYIEISIAGKTWRGKPFELAMNFRKFLCENGREDNLAIYEGAGMDLLAFLQTYGKQGQDQIGEQEGDTSLSFIFFSQTGRIVSGQYNLAIEKDPTLMIPLLFIRGEKYQFISCGSWGTQSLRWFADLPS